MMIKPGTTFNNNDIQVFTVNLNDDKMESGMVQYDPNSQSLPIQQLYCNILSAYDSKKLSY